MEKILVAARRDGVVHSLDGEVQSGQGTVEELMDVGWKLAVLIDFPDQPCRVMLFEKGREEARDAIRR